MKEILDKVFEEASPEAQFEQMKINQGLPSEVVMNDGKVIKIRPITSAAAERMSAYLVRQVEITEAETPELIARQKTNLRLQCKAIAIAMLNDGRLGGIAGWFKINFLFWFYWRKIFWAYTSGDISAILVHIIEKLNLVFFYQNMALTKGINTLRKKKTKKEQEAELSHQEQGSGKKPDS